jgi:Ca-activated chloride channel family protein
VAALASHAAQVFRATTTLQSIAVQVTGKNGEYLKDLSASNFTLLEDGRPQKISFFESEHQPISLAVLVDASRSMEYGGKLERARMLLAPLLQGNNPNDEIFFMPFTDEAGPFQQLTASERMSPPPIVPPGHRGSAIYDALATALCHMRNSSNVRQAVLVISDGVDEHSRLRLEELLQLVRSSNPQVFMVGLYNAREQEIFHEQHKKLTIVGLREIDNPLFVFKRLADESGAESFFPSSEHELKKALDRVLTLLKAQYTLAYYPQHPESVRKIEVKIDLPGAKVFDRRTVGPQSAAGEVHFSVTGCAVSAKEHPYPWESRIKSKPGAQTVYREDFSDIRSGWPNGHEVQRDAHYAARGGYELFKNFCPSQAAMAGDTEFVTQNDNVVAAYGPWWNNFRAMATVKVTTGGVQCPGGTKPAAGLLFHVMEQGFYGLLVASHAHGDRISFALVRGAWNGFLFPLIPWTELSIEPHAGGEYNLTVEYTRPVIKIGIGGKTVGSVHDATLPGGLMGFGVFDKGHLRVRDLTVESLPTLLAGQ